MDEDDLPENLNVLAQFKTSEYKTWNDGLERNSYRENRQANLQKSSYNSGANAKEYRSNKTSDNARFTLTENETLDISTDVIHKLELFVNSHSPSHVLLYLRSFRHFQNILQADISDHKNMEIILLSLSKACMSDRTRNLTVLMEIISASSKFLPDSLKAYLEDIISFVSNISSYSDSVFNLLCFLEKFNEYNSYGAFKVFPVLLPLLNSLSTKFKLEKKFNKKLSQIEKYKSFLSKSNEFQSHFSFENDFRTLSVLPTSSDIFENDDNVVEKNIISGPYENVGQYLRIHFHLLREDVIFPLKDGIEKFKRSKSSVYGRKKCGDLFLYSNVHVLCPEFSKFGALNHVIHIEIANHKNIKWETSKRLLPGSLVCLSNDNFQTILFATVVVRKTDEIKKGFVVIHFEKIEEALRISPNKSFTMLESLAYFEAYKHTLLTLQTISAEVFPFKDYIINVKTKVSSPRYLTHSTVYDLRPLLIPLNEIPYASEPFMDCELIYEFFEKSVSSRKSSRVQLLDDNNWPAAVDLDMDGHQFEAVKSALTKEFSIIQGPPGTGKTYIGLRVVQILLHNWQRWNSIVSSTPILIVCYTNHALDQFLEGILRFTSKIIRIGGQSQSKVLEKFLLSNLISDKNIYRKPKFLTKLCSAAFNQLRKALKEINSLQIQLEDAANDNLTCFDLKDYMKSQHYQVLHDCCLQDWLMESSSQNFSFSVDSNQDSSLQNNLFYDDTADNTEVLQDESEDEEEIDINYILEMRQIHTGLTLNSLECELENDGDDNLIGNVDVCDILDSSAKAATFIQKYEKKLEKAVKKVNKKFVVPKPHVKVKSMLTSDEAFTIQDIWQLNSTERRQLYQFWLAQFVKDKIKHIESICKRIKYYDEEFQEIIWEIKLHFLRKAKVIGMTTTGVTKFRDVILHLQPKVIIIEEAAQVLEAHTVTSFSELTEHAILIGDHQQLRPNPTVNHLAVDYKLDVSLFERMVSNKVEYITLVLQHRMHPSISKYLVPYIYEELKNHSSVEHFGNIIGVNMNAYFITHENLEEKYLQSFINVHEAQFLIELCKYLLLQGFSASQITFLTLYSGQELALKKLVNEKLMVDVFVASVDSFQGEENDIILLSLVRSNSDGKIGFSGVPNRVCVALSRARRGLYCIGNFKLLTENSDLWKNIIEAAKKDNAFGSKLPLHCQNHPGTITFVEKVSDFELVRDGGCSLKCGYMQDCGHECIRRCHVLDLEHKEAKCIEVCGKISCDKGHPCVYMCFETCGPCKFPVSKTIPNCNHTVSVPCNIDPNDFLCTYPCTKSLSCGHSCQKTCSEECSHHCIETVNVKAPCGHAITLECGQTCDIEKMLTLCTKSCGSNLNCGHICSGDCKSCFQGRIHVQCTHICEKTLVCGHMCKAKCMDGCPLCVDMCEKHCPHKECIEDCGIPCPPCGEPLISTCIHTSCNCLCGEPCIHSPCKEKCPKDLPCGHQCLGFCRDPCPKLCYYCDEISKHRNFSSQVERYIQLEDCGHIFTADKFSDIMKDVNNMLFMKCCPLCKKPIYRNSRFNNTINISIKNIENVKQQIYEQMNNFKPKHVKLKELVQTLELQSNTPLKPLFSKINKDIQKKSNVRILFTLENSLHIIKEFENVVDNLSKFLSGIWEMNPSCLAQSLKPNAKYTFIFITVRRIIIFLNDNFMSASFQQQENLSMEIMRLGFLNNLLKYVTKFGGKGKLKPEAQEIYKNTLNILTEFSPFDNAKINFVESSFQSIFNFETDNSTFVLDVKSIKLLKPLDFQKGHWYTCSNNHVYSNKNKSNVENSKCKICAQSQKLIKSTLSNEKVRYPKIKEKKLKGKKKL